MVISPEKVLLIGEKEKLDTIEMITINDTIDISDKTEDTIETIDLRKYLPDGVYVSGENTVEVKIEINKLVTKKLSINTDKIQVKDLNSDYELTFINKSVSVELQGEEKNMSGISADSIVASINLKDYKEGTETVDVTVVVPEGTVLLNKVSVKVKIKKKK